LRCFIAISFLLSPRFRDTVFCLDDFAMKSPFDFLYAGGPFTDHDRRHNRA
jgi:hypothetical protein